MKRKYPVDHLLKPVHKFIRQEFIGGIVLFLAVAVALVWANSPFGESYHKLWETKLGVSIGTYSFRQSLHTWIKDGLMALFFL